jgi:two-component system sensor histidine kinase DesK
MNPMSQDDDIDCSRRRSVGPWAALIWAPLLLLAAGFGATRTARPVLTWICLVVIALTFAWAVSASALRPAGSRRGAKLMLGVQALATAAVVISGGPWGTWVALPILLAIGVGAVLRTWWTPVVAALIAALSVAGVRGNGGPVGEAFWTAGLSTFLAGAVTSAFYRLSSVVDDLRRTREELARVAVSSERLRFSRDLHDLLGHTLSVIVVKAEAVRRLVPTDAEAAAGHAADIESIGRQALADVRAAVEGYRSVSLSEELERARTALTAGGVGVTISRTGPTPTEQQEELLSWVVREGATNVMRHARASSCRITVRSGGGPLVLQIDDDGVGATDPGSGGRGLEGLRERLAAAGGELVATGGEDGFRVVATVPQEVGHFS